MTGLDDFLPNFDFGERHQRHIQASPESAWRALTEITLGQLSITRPLVAVRNLGSSGSRLDQPLFRHGPLTMVLMNAPWYAVGGFISRPWQRSPTRQAITSLDELMAFDEPGWAVCLTDFRLRPTDRGTLLTTETRVACTDRRARRRFRLYWLLIRPFSGLIRRDMLSAAGRIAVAAERAHVQTPG
ncbi:MAG TPA: hypothetical protein VII33_17820 [Nakamurella sp.]